MNWKQLQVRIGQNLEQIRHKLQFNARQMGDAMGVVKSTYSRNEIGKTAPNLWSMFILASNYNVSLDWLICRRGEPFYKSPEKVQADARDETAEKDSKKGKTKKSVFTGELEKDLKDLIEHMETSPRIRYEILTLFHKIKGEEGKSA
jgi:transcriptional regulator with XRE-family HTH domain